MISERLKIARKKNKMTQKELALKVNKTKATISNYENNYSTPSNKILKELAEVLNTSTDYLLGRAEDLFYNESDEEKNWGRLREKSDYYISVKGLGEQDIRYIEREILRLKKKNREKDY